MTEERLVVARRRQALRFPMFATDPIIFHLHMRPSTSSFAI